MLQIAIEMQDIEAGPCYSVMLISDRWIAYVDEIWALHSLEMEPSMELHMARAGYKGALWVSRVMGPGSEPYVFSRCNRVCFGLCFSPQSLPNGQGRASASGIFV